MSTGKNQNSQKPKNISYSSIETQKQLRIEKINKLKEKGISPFTPYSKRDFSLGFIRFWFDFVHKFNFQEIEDDRSIFAAHYFLEQVLFPQSLLEKVEEKLQLRQTIREMGLDPDKEEGKIEEEFDPEVVKEARGMIYNLSTTSEETKLNYLNDFLFLDSHDFIDDLEADDEKEVKFAFEPHQVVTLAGRIKTKRVSGKIAFGVVEDESLPEGFQFIFKRDEISTQPDKKHNHLALKYNDALSFQDFKDLIDEGDYIQATGKLDYSLRGEPSLFVQKFRILTKALRPLSEKLDYENLEERYINRVLDYKMNTKDDNNLSNRDIVYLKNRYWQIWREEMEKEGFLEVECPIFEDIPGGADAKPFTTYYNELEQEMYLRISLELPLKKLIAGGFEKVYEIGRIFRNEGASPHHLQEYTQIEWYWAYTDYIDAMKFISKVYRNIAKEIIGGYIQTDYYGNTINWDEWCTPQEAKKNGWELINGWPAIKYFDAIRYYSRTYYKEGEIDLENKTYEELLEIAKQNQIEIEQAISYGNLLDKIYKKVARPFIQDPIFLFHQPVELEPLAKRDPRDPKIVHRWQIVAGTAELGKAFSELNDPLDQLDRFQEQQAARDAGDEEAQFMNEKYIEALELGLPPLSGFGMSERLLSFMLGKNIKECVTFPHVRRQDEVKKNQKTLVAHAIIFDDPKIETWIKYNSIAHLTAAYGARNGKKLFQYEAVKTIDSDNIPMNTSNAIVIKESADQTKIKDIFEKVKQDKSIQVEIFTQEMQDTSNDRLVVEKTASKKFSDVKILGILVYGKKSTIEKLTNDFELMV